MTALTETQAVGQFPITVDDLTRWKASGDIASTIDDGGVESFDGATIDRLVKHRQATERATMLREVIGQMRVSTPSHLDRVLAVVTALAAILAVVVAGYQFGRTREVLLADNEYRVWSDILQAAERIDAAGSVDLSPIDDRIVAVKAMYDADNLSMNSWRQILLRVCHDDLYSSNALQGTDNLKLLCRELRTP